MSVYIVQIISTEYQACPSPGGPPTGEWVLTDVADNTQLGNKDRTRDKGTSYNYILVYNRCGREKGFPHAERPQKLFFQAIESTIEL